AEVRTLPPRQYGYETGDFQRMKQEVGQIPARSAAKGFRGASAVPDGQPSGGMKELRGQSFSPSYPANWQAFSGHHSDSVTIGPQNGIVQTSTGATSIG